MIKNKIKRIAILVTKFLPFLTIIIFSVLPAYHTFGRLNIGGDVMIFLDSKIIASKYLYQWVVNDPNGQFYSTSYYAVYGIYKFLNFLGLNFYGISFVLLFFLNLVAGFGVWFLTRMFSKDYHPALHAVSIAFYLLSPALLNAWHYNYIYAAIPWFFYLTFKVIKSRKFTITDIVLFSVAILFSSTELPNPKYLFYLSLVFIISIVAALVFKMVSFIELKKISWGIVFVILISSYLFLPMAYFVKNYSAATYGIHTQENYLDEGQMMNYGRDTLDKVLKLHQDQIFLNADEAKSYNKNKIVTIFSYSFIFLIVLGFAQFNNLSRSDKKLRLIIYLLLLVFIFFSAGPNPPLGYLYQLAVSKIGVFAFLRTTAGGVFILSIIYTLLLFLTLGEIKKFKLFAAALVFAFVLLAGYPYINGEYFKNLNNVSKFTDRSKNGFIIPDAYFEIKDVLENRKLDAKMYYPNSTLVYLNTTWGFFGPVIYNFLYQNSSISFDKMYSLVQNHNVGYVFIDNSLLEKKSFDDVKTKSLLIKSDFVNLYTINRDKFLPHFFVPSKIVKANMNQDELKERSKQEDIQTAFALSGQNTKYNLDDFYTSDIVPTIEYRKINIAKYRLIIHGAKSDFPLVFSETFNEDWRIYSLPLSVKQKSNLLEKINTYKIVTDNELDQANSAELIGLVNDGLISDLGDGGNSEFVSKNFRGTIQNDNLSLGNIIETWRAKQISASRHYIVNGYANAWEISPDSVCSQVNCINNADGTRDFQFIVEFWPQRLVYIGLGVGIATVLIIFFGILILRRMERNEFI